jgi:DHA1 family bicyclomycin/chloramphenicol resistance-like MFS transporter
MTTAPLPHDSPKLLALLAALVALGPMTVDMYLPAMPQMMVALNTDIAHMHMTLSAYLTGFAVFHLACGPLADRYGRRPLLLIGVLLFVLASVGCALASDVEELLWYRFLQGVGACVGPTLARAIVRDVFGADRAARALSIIAMLMALAPAVAPALGGIMLLYLPWNSIFLFLALYGASVTLLVYRYLGETLPARQSLHPAKIGRNYAELLVNRYFISVSVASSLIYAGLLVYLSSSSFVFITMFGLPAEYFGLIFISSIFGYILGSALSARLSRRHASELVMLTGVKLAAASCGTMWLAHVMWPDNLYTLILPMVTYSAALGLVLPHAMAIALRPFAHIAGTASSLFGFVQMTLSAAATAFMGYFLVNSPIPMIQAMFVITLVAFALAVRVERLSRSV